jgi:hypothetical protein
VKYNDEAIEKLIEFMINVRTAKYGLLCPSDLGLKDNLQQHQQCIDRKKCIDCWKQALAGEQN